MKKFLFTLLVSITMTGFVFSQTNSSSQPKVMNMVKVSWDEIVEYNKLHPSDSMQINHF